MLNIKDLIKEYSANLQIIEDRKALLKSIEETALAELKIDKADFKKVATASFKEGLDDLIEGCEVLKDLAEKAV